MRQLYSPAPISPILRIPSTGATGSGDVLPGDTGATLSLARVVEEVERTTIKRALAKTGGKKVKAAELLGIDYKTLVSKMSRYNEQK